MGLSTTGAPSPPSTRRDPWEYPRFPRLRTTAAPSGITWARMAPSTDSSERPFTEQEPGFGDPDLQTKIPADSGWTLLGASGINEHGQIVGNGLHDGILRAFLLGPVK